MIAKFQNTFRKLKTYLYRSLLSRLPPSSLSRSRRLLPDDISARILEPQIRLEVKKIIYVYFQNTKFFKLLRSIQSSARIFRITSIFE
jgi:hypothetical protein